MKTQFKTSLLLPFGFFFWLLSCAAAAQDLQDHYDNDCLPLKEEGRHGPFDYRTAKQGERDLVEKYHFTEHYRAYRMGKAKFQKQVDKVIETPASGFGYTLWAFPNHPQALAAVEDLGIKQKSDKVHGLQLRVACYFQRAVRLAPNDGLVRALYGYYYARRGQVDEAERQLSSALALRENDVNVLNYTATSYIEMGKLDQAVDYAKKLYAAGYPFPGLRDRLHKAGRSLD